MPIVNLADGNQVWASSQGNSDGRTIHSLDPSKKLSWGKGFSPQQVAGSYGTTFGGEGDSTNPYSSGASQKVRDAARRGC
eukprot:993475-Rhodomonas_salina.1